MRDARLSAPFFVISLVLGIVTIWFQRHVAIGGDEAAFNPIGGPLARIVCAGSAIAFYLGKSFFPTQLAPVYPRWSVEHPAVLVLLAWPAILILLYWFWRERRAWGRHALFGSGWFLIFLAPVIGLVPITSQRFTWVMDHLAYVPLVGLVGLAAAGFSAGVDRLGRAGRGFGFASALALCTVLAALSHRHAAMFQSEETLWRDTIRDQPNAWFAHFNLGNLRRQQGRQIEALAEYDEALRIQPGFADAHYNRANTLRESGRADDAIASYREALRLKPTLYLAHGNLGVALAQRNRTTEAIAECEQALKLKPSYTEARLNLALLLMRASRPAEAIGQLEELLRQQPDSVPAQFNLGNALLASGRAADAIGHYERAAALMPAQAQIHAQLARALSQAGRTVEARAQYARARELDPSLPAAPL
jgi:protein O-mannosyl-transferase